MAPHSFHTVDVFTERRFGGNPLAVFPDARGIADDAMQALASELNLSETTFVLPPSDPVNTARVRIFTRTAEIPFAGHPNVGTAFVLARLAESDERVLRFEEAAGLVAVTILRDHDGAPTGATVAAPQPLSVGVRLPARCVAESAGLEESDVVTTNHAPTVASVGLPFVFAQTSASALARCAPDVEALRRTLAAHPELDGRISLYLYAREGSRIRARMFAPLEGTHEDPATGSAASALAALLLGPTQQTQAAYEIEQGVEMGRPSSLQAAAERTGDEIRATVGGACVPVLHGEAEL